MMTTAEEVSKERNITARAVQKKAKELGIEKRNGKYVFTQNELERMYGDQPRDLKHPTNEPATNRYEPSTNWNERTEPTNEHLDEQQTRFAKMTQSCQDKLIEVEKLMAQQQFKSEDLEKSRQNLLQSIVDIRVCLDTRQNEQQRNNESKEMTVNLDVDNLIVE